MSFAAPVSPGSGQGRAKASPLPTAGLWIAAAGVAVAAHLAALALLLSTPARVPAGEVEVFAVEIAPEFFAPPADLVSDSQPSVDAGPAVPEAPPAPEAPTEPTELAEPAPDTPPPEPPPPLADAAPVPDAPPTLEPPPPDDPPPEAPPPEVLPETTAPAEIAFAPPPRRPEVVERTPEPEPERQERREPPRRATPPTGGPVSAAPVTNAQRAATSAAPTTSEGTPGNPRALATWTEQVNRIVARHMKRWRNPGQQVRVAMVINYDGGGRITGVQLRGSTGEAGVDGSLLAHARRLPDLPPPTTGRGNSTVLPLILERGR